MSSTIVNSTGSASAAMPAGDVRAGLLDNLTTTTTKCNHPSLFSASTPLPLNTSYPPHHTTAPPHLTTPHQYQETTALDAGYCFVGLDDLPSSGLPCGPGQSGRSNNLLRKLSGAFRSMNQQATTWVNPSYVAGSSKSPRNQRYSFPSKQTYNSHSHTREAKPRHPHPNEMYQNKETVIGLHDGTAAPQGMWNNYDVLGTQQDELLRQELNHQQFMEEQRQIYAYYQNQQRCKEMHATYSENYSSDFDEGWNIVNVGDCIDSKCGSVNGNTAPYGVSSANFMMGNVQFSVVDVNQTSHRLNFTYPFGPHESSLPLHDPHRGNETFPYAAISHAFTVMEAPEARLNEGYRHPCSSHPKRRSPLAGNGVEKLNHINEMGSALNPDAQEWKGWIASSKLNPEAKEWIPGPITDNIVVNYQDKSEPTALPSPLDEEQMMKGITAARTNSSGDLEKAESEMQSQSSIKSGSSVDLKVGSSEAAELIAPSCALAEIKINGKMPVKTPSVNDSLPDKQDSHIREKSSTSQPSKPNSVATNVCTFEEPFVASKIVTSTTNCCTQSYMKPSHESKEEASLDATKNEEPKHFLEDQNEATIDTNQSKQSVIGDKEVEMESPVRGDLNEVQEDAISRDRNVAHETENKCSEILANTSSVASCKSKRSPCWLFEKLRNMSFNPRKSYKNDVDSVTSCSGDEDDDCGVEFCDLDDDNVKDDDDGITFEEDDSEPAECDENDDSSSDDESGAESNDDCIEERESSTDDESYDECYSGSDTESDEVDFCAGFPSKLLSGTKPQVGPGSNTKPQVGPSSSVKLQVGPSSNPKPQDGPGSNPKPQDGPGSNPKPQVEPDSNAKPYRSPTQALCAMWRCQSNKPQPPPGLSFSDDDWESDGNSGSISASNWAFGEGLMTIKTPINTVCKMLGYVEKERKNSLTEVEKANLKWDTAINDDVRGHSGQKVSFNDSVSMCYVDIDVDRKGEWQQIGRDNERFRKRISGLCGILSPVLEAGHRNAVYNARFRENELGDEDLAENVAR
ncbi:uncharacterized protein LOC108664490 isoform X1 [Hyalella azteca]|uniref:Uncharacterized protein LOC108664490 isoform X1 n=1 Tax=Hyalella azteca TaxID=294128 RepID=A0A8B7MZ82_HYAAZ|nr:uncharacterized protein LOC108664490 isoform X1 [Hyalella azteca]